LSFLVDEILLYESFYTMLQALGTGLTGQTTLKIEFR